MNIKHLNISMLAILAVASASLASCGSDNEQDYVISKPVIANPTGFVVMAYPDEVVNGDTATILLRLNPSTAQLTKEQVTIDCVNSDVYTIKENQTDEQSRAVSYVTTSANYTLLDITPDTLHNDTLQGQWRAKVLVKTDKNIFDKSTLALVASYKDNEGKTINVSSDAFQMTLVPTPADGVTAWSPTLYTDTTKVKNADRTPYYWVVEGNTYQNVAGKQMDYEIDKRIRNTHFALGTIDNDTTTQAQTVLHDGNAYLYSFLPLVDKAPFSDIAAGNAQNYRAQAYFTLEDKTGHESILMADCDYEAKKNVQIEVDCPKEVKVGDIFTINLDEALAGYGYSSKALKDLTSHHYGQVGQRVVINSSGTNAGWSISYNLNEDDYKTLTLTVGVDCDADEALSCLRAFMITADLQWYNNTTKPLALYYITMKRKGA